MGECFGKSFIKNGELLPSEFFDDSLVYEVIRMVEGCPVFFYDHTDRLEKSVKIHRKDMVVSIGTLRRDILRLSGSEKNKEGNLKIVFNYNSGSFNYLAYFTEPIYPAKDQYNNGVKGILFNAERKDPASKVINHLLRSDIYHKLILERAYEALLVDHLNRITEGSRSNIFFIKGGVLHTAPENCILNGITRKYIIDLCNEHKLQIMFECVKADEIGKYDAAFMSGTSPIILPFCCINDKLFDAKLPLMSKLRELYLDKANDSIRRFLTE
jgi:branched-chain amino acid aminotransferase